MSVSYMYRGYVLEYTIFRLDREYNNVHSSMICMPRVCTHSVHMYNLKQLTRGDQMYALYSTLRRTSHLPADLGISINFLLDAHGARSRACACFYRTHKTQRVRNVCNVF